jgi:glutamine amidotransferase
VIALVDYGAGNLTSVRKALAAVGADVWTPGMPGELARARAIIVPGVGHFDATRALTEAWRTAIRASADRGVPLLGICVGLQWLFDGSTEAPGAAGLGVFTGMCDRLGRENEAGYLFRANPGKTYPASSSLKVPHVGWNSLSFPRASALMNGLAEDTQVYFTHSYAAPVVDDTVAVCEYGVPFSAAVERGHVAAVQFHPEKSGEAGLRILRNWLGHLT